MTGALSREEQPTLAGSVDRLTKAGYTDWFRAESGSLRAARAGCLHLPADMQIDEYLRFEGETNPDDAAIIFALRCKPHGVRGTYTVPYGTDTPAADVEILQDLQSKPTSARTN